jgi:hypothetical protein
MTFLSSEKGATPFPSGSPSGFLPLEEDPEVMNFFMRVHSLSLCLTAKGWFRQAESRSFSNWSLGCCDWRLKSRSAAATWSCPSEPSASSSPSLWLAVDAICLGRLFWPFLPPLAPFLPHLPVAWVGVHGSSRGPFSHHPEQRRPRPPPRQRHAGWRCQVAPW